MALAESGPAPYAPSARIMLVVEMGRDKGLPAQLNTTTLKRLGVEDSLVNRTMAALKQLDLVDDSGAPTATMDKIRKASTAEYQVVLAEWVRAAYAPILQYVDPTDPVERIADQFRHYEPAGMRNRMVTLFLGLCLAAGLVEEKPKMPRPTRTAGQSKPRPPKSPASVPTMPPDDTGTNRGVDNAGKNDNRDRYVQFLLDLAEKSDSPDPALLDRIERALGMKEGSA